MTQTRDLRARRSRGDRRTALVAVLVLSIMGGIGWWMSRSIKKQHADVLASVPAFPSRDEAAKEHRRPLDPTVEWPAPSPSPAPAGSPVPSPKPVDALARFAMHPSKTVGLVEVNAIVNTPFFERLQECYETPEEKSHGKAPFDWKRDVDRIAFTDDGMVMSGFFDEKGVEDWINSQKAATQEGVSPVTKSEYRGFSLVESDAMAFAHKGSLLVTGDRQTIRSTVDRVLDPVPQDAPTSDIYGDVYFRTDMASLQKELADDRANGGGNKVLDSILQRLDGVTLRANVWDSVAVTLDSTPTNGQSIDGLATVIRGALSLAKDQVDSDDIRLAALAELANVDTDDKNIKIKLAVPVKDLFEKFHFPCPAKDRPARSSEKTSGAPQGDTVKADQEE